MASSIHTLTFRSLKRSHDFFESNHGSIPNGSAETDEYKMRIKERDQYGIFTVNSTNKQTKELSVYSGGNNNKSIVMRGAVGDNTLSLPRPVRRTETTEDSGSTANEASQQLVVPKKAKTMPKPDWHAPWKLCRVVSGHTGWVRCISFSPDNNFFMTGSDDRLIKIWDFFTGKLRLSLTGHVSSVRGVAISERHPYAFSCGEDKTVKCWDLEQNKVIRHYHGHTSAVYAIGMHPLMDILVTGGRDSVVRVWDMRTKINVHVLAGHQDAIASLACQKTLPEIISGSHDATIRLWDLRTAKTQTVLTNHKKAVRSVCIHPTTDYFVSASADGIKQFALPHGSFQQNLRGHQTIVNSVVVNENNVVASGGNDGTIFFWDWKSGSCFQKVQSKPQPGSLDAENVILGLSFDRSNQRLVTVEGDKTIKYYMEDPDATEETHPVMWRPNVVRRTLY